MTAPQALEIFRQNVADRAVYFADGDFPANGCRQISFANQQLRNLHFPATPPSAKQIADGRKSLFSFDFLPPHIPATTPSYYVGEGTSAPLLHVGSSPPPCRWLVDAARLSCRLIDPLTTLPMKGHCMTNLHPDHPTTHTTILALDLGTTTGWAVQSADGSITSGTQQFKPQRFEGGGMRFLRFKRWLLDIKTLQNGLHEVYFEEVRRHASTDASHVYGGFLGLLSVFCEHHQIAYQGVPVGTIKRHATGKGNASKDEVIGAMKRLGYSPVDDNEADALALLHWAVAQVGNDVGRAA